MKSIVRLLLAGVLAAALPACWAQAPAAKTEVLWLGQSAFRITTPGGKVIVTDPWLRTNPLTPPEYKNLEALGKVDVLLVTHGHFDHFADAPALALLNKVPMYAPGDMNQTVGLLGILPANLVPRFNKSGTITPAAGHQGHRGARRAFVGDRVEEPRHRQGRVALRRRAGGLHHRAGERLSHLPHGRHGPVRRHEVHRRLLQARPGADADRRPLHHGPGRRGVRHARVAQAPLRDPDALRRQPAGTRHARRNTCGRSGQTATRVLPLKPGEKATF